MTPIYGLYDDPDVAQRAVDGLRAAGTAASDIVVMSSEPFEEHEFSRRDSATWMHWLAGLGGVAGCAFGYWLTSTTQRAWPIVTSGMPIVSPWPNLIVIFELTMLGAIASTVITLLVSTKLPRRMPKFYDPEVSNGYILVGVERPDDKADAIAQALEAAGPGRIRNGR
jgi:Protein of unknown function (DUF3341)